MSDEKPKKVKTPKIPKIEKSEGELVHQYANKIIDGKIARGHFDKRFGWHNREAQGKPAKDVWMDTDFFFSVVFQSAEQKETFMKAWLGPLGIEIEEDTRIQIVNGMELAKAMKVGLPKVSVEKYPYSDPELKTIALDTESL